MTDAREVIETVARAISLAIWRLDYTPRDPQHIPDERYERAQAAARAIITALTASGYRILKDSTHEERSWPEDESHENGNYHCLCAHCLRAFTGHKRRHECRACAAP